MQNSGRIAPREREGVFNFVARMSEAISGYYAKTAPDITSLIRATRQRHRAFFSREPCMSQPRLDAAAEPGHSVMHMRWPIAADVCRMDRMSHFAMQQNQKDGPC